MVSKFSFYLSAFPNYFHFFLPPYPILLLPSLYIPISFSWQVTWLQKAHITVESQRHQRALHTVARTSLNVMKSDDHSQEKYIDFLKDVKDLIQDHVSELKTHDVTEIRC